jgi:hypothetical protein
LAHGQNLNPHCKEKNLQHDEPASLYCVMIKKNMLLLDVFIKQKPHIIFDLVWLLKAEQNGRPCRLCTGSPVLKKGKRKTQLFFCLVNTSIEHPLFICTPHLQHKMDAPWQMTRSTSPTNGNGTNPIR